MRTRTITLFLVLAIALTIVAGCLHRLPKQQACQVCVEFEPPLVNGTNYGSTAGHNDGDVVFTTNNIPVSVHNFNFPAGGGAFNVATIVIPPIPFGINQTISTNNINLGFDFSNIGFTPSEVQFEFIDLGGFENISVNGSLPFSGELSTVPSPMRGVDIKIFTTPVTGGKKGIAILSGPVKNFIVGGQEFWIDRVCARK